MTSVFSSDQAASGGGLGTLETLEGYEASILAITGLRGWYDPSNSLYRVAGTGSGCAQLTDRSGGGFHLLQATAGNQPPVTADYWAALNGVHRDALVFDGSTDLRMQTAGNLFDGTTLWSYMWIGKPAAAANNVPWSPGSGTGNLCPVIETSTKMTWVAGGTGAFATLASTIVGSKLVEVGTYNYPGSGTVALSIDANGSTGTATPALGTTAPGTSPLLIGSYQSGHALKYNGGFGELIIAKSVFDAPTIAMLKAYAAFKYR